jgi:hypothetical protein
MRNIRTMEIDSMKIFRTLRFSQAWIELGIITSAKLEQFEALWVTGEDTNTEHYRWKAFLDFIKLQTSLDEKTAIALYELGENDPDIAMGGSIMGHILQRKDCPKSLLERGTQSENKFLQKTANEKLAALN